MLAQEAIKIATACADKNSGDTGYFSIKAWCNLNGYKHPLGILKAYGREASRLSSENGLPVYKINDELLGYVGQYHKNILSEILPPKLTNQEHPDVWRRGY